MQKAISNLQRKDPQAYLEEVLQSPPDSAAEPVLPIQDSKRLPQCPPAPPRSRKRMLLTAMPQQVRQLPVVKHISDPKSLSIIEKHVNFKLPKDGLHCPYLKQKGTKVVLYYRIIIPAKMTTRGGKGTSNKQAASSSSSSSSEPGRFVPPRWNSTFMVLKWVKCNGYFKAPVAMSTAIASINKEDTKAIEDSTGTPPPPPPPQPVPVPIPQLASKEENENENEIVRM